MNVHVAVRHAVDDDADDADDESGNFPRTLNVYSADTTATTTTTQTTTVSDWSPPYSYFAYGTTCACAVRAAQAADGTDRARCTSRGAAAARTRAGRGVRSLGEPTAAPIVRTTAGARCRRRHGPCTASPPTGREQAYYGSRVVINKTSCVILLVLHVHVLAPNENS